MQPKVNILISTYNGASYLPEQLDSIIAQTHKSWDLYIRDDGSQDDTVQILQKYASRDNRIHFLLTDSQRLGACASFAYLLEQCIDADYIMFCDQDDYWLPEKVQISLNTFLHLEEHYKDLPLLLHTDLQVVDSELKLLSKSFWEYQKLDPVRCKLNQLLVQNNVTGCTVMINKALRNLALPIPREAIMHDWWLALVASAFGKVSYVNEALILYRQHGRNDVGATKFGISYVLFRLTDFVNTVEIKQSINLTIRQAEAFLISYSRKLQPLQSTIVREYSSLNKDNWLLRRLKLIRFRFFKHGILRTIGLFLAA